jgi:ribosomal protein S18 acetylase RimI-like enzyme
VALRRAAAADEPLLLRLVAANRSIAGADVGARLLEQQASSAVRTWRARTPPPDEQIVLLHGRAVGMLVTARETGVLHLIEIGLVPECRGEGIGSVVLAHLLRVADHERRTIRASVYPSNPRAHALYRRFGFMAVAADQLAFRLERPPGPRRAGAA